MPIVCVHLALSLVACGADGTDKAPKVEAQASDIDDPEFPPELMIRIAQAMQEPNPDAVVNWMATPADYVKRCPDYDWERRHREPNDELRAKIARQLHNCVPPGAIESVSLNHGFAISEALGDHCDEALNLWNAVSFDVVTAGGRATIDLDMVVLDGEEEFAWLLAKINGYFPYCIVHATPTLALPAEPGLGPELTHAATIGASLEQIASSWEEATTVGRTRCRTASLVDMNWYSSGGGGGAITNFDPDTGACIFVVGMGQFAHTVFIERAYDPAFAASLVQRWGPPDLESGQDGDAEKWMMAWKGAGPDGTQLRLSRHRNVPDDVWRLALVRSAEFEQRLVKGIYALDDLPSLLGQRRKGFGARYPKLLCAGPSALDDQPDSRFFDLCPLEQLDGAAGPMEAQIEFSSTGRVSKLSLTVDPAHGGDLEARARAELEGYFGPMSKESAAVLDAYVGKRGDTRVSFNGATRGLDGLTRFSELTFTWESIRHSDK